MIELTKLVSGKSTVLCVERIGTKGRFARKIVVFRFVVLFLLRVDLE